METTPKIPAITQLIADGYGKGMLGTVIETMRWMAASMKADGVISDSDEARILNLLMLEEAILKDCYSIDINETI
jgi:hypothetical protein